MREDSRRWIEAAKILALDAGAQVSCPVCGDGVLAVTDIDYELDVVMIERHLICPVCGASNSLRINRSNEDRNY